MSSHYGQITETSLAVKISADLRNLDVSKAYDATCHVQGWSEIMTSVNETLRRMAVKAGIKPSTEYLSVYVPEHLLRSRDREDFLQWRGRVAHLITFCAQQL